MKDREVLDFLVAQAGSARYVTSVCRGALVLGAAGLLRGYKAMTHWAAHDVLRVFGAEPVKQRLVVDRKRITGGGVAAGLDFGFTLLALLRGENVAKVTQLAIEYDAQPPFHAESPEAAGPGGYPTGLGHSCTASEGNTRHYGGTHGEAKLGMGEE